MIKIFEWDKLAKKERVLRTGKGKHYVNGKFIIRKKTGA